MAKKKLTRSATPKKFVKPRHDRLLQTTVSNELFEWVTRSAHSEGISVAAFIRRLMILASAREAVEKHKARRTR